jgi:hypothetical protein
MVMRLLTLTEAGSTAVFLAFQAEPSVPAPPNSPVEQSWTDWFGAELR